MSRTCFLAGLGLLALLYTLYIQYLNSQGVGISVLILCLLAWLLVIGMARYEGQPIKQSLDPRKASWAFLADPILAVGVAASVMVNRHYELDWRWSVFGALVAAGFGAFVIRMLDRKRYKKYEAMGSYHSLSKYAHDFFELPVYCGAVVGVVVPALFFGAHSGWYWLGVVCAMVWVVGAAKDVLKEPDPRNQHPNIPMLAH